MTLHTMKTTVILLIFSAGLMVLSCKGKEKEKDINTTTNADTMTTADTSGAVTTAPATVTEAQLLDATKDFPGVQATVNNGEVTLTGTISRENLPRLMQSIQALNPTKVNNNLTIK
jgi:osmotically-inducible protein OsmY